VKQRRHVAKHSVGHAHVESKHVSHRLHGGDAQHICQQEKQVTALLYSCGVLHQRLQVHLCSRSVDQLAAEEAAALLTRDRLYRVASHSTPIEYLQPWGMHAA